jgi:branched-subunit amino acid aminotransferase/4-amino-4-deoxychorismate lyase
MNGCAPRLIETVRIRDGRAPLWPLHRARLEASCQALGIPFPCALEEPYGGADRAIRLEVGRDGAAISERTVGPTDPVRLAISAVTHQPYPHKTTERMLFDRARAEALGLGADDALLLTARGEVAEASIWSLFWWEGEILCAPALDLGILPGVSRRRIAAFAGPVTERRCGRDGLRGRSLFVSNAVRGMVEVAALDGEPVPPHAATAEIRRRFWSG